MDSIHFHFERLLEGLKALISESTEEREARNVEAAKAKLRFFIIKLRTRYEASNNREKLSLLDIYSARINAASTKKDIFTITDKIEENLLSVESI